MSVKKNLLKNGIATGFQKLITVFEQLLLVPFFISAWGTEYYGEWLTLTIIPSVLALSDFGFGSSASSALVLKYASGDIRGAADMGKTGFAAISGLIGTGLLLSGVTIAILNNYKIFDKSVIENTDAIWSVSLLILARLLGFYKHLFEGYFRAARRASLSINLWSLNSLFNLVSGICILSLGWGIIEFAASQLAVSILFNSFYARKAVSLLGLDNKARGQIKAACVREISSKGFGYLLSPIWQSIFFQGTTFAVRLTLGAEAVAVFNTARTLSRSVNQFYSMVNNSVFPELQYEYGAGNLSKSQQMFRISIIGVFFIALIGALLLWLIGPWVYKVWTKNQLTVPDTVWLVFIIGIIFNALWWTAGMVFRAANKPYQLAIMGLIASILSVIASYFLSKEYGLLGAAYGSLVMDVIMAIYILPVSCRLMDISVSSLFSSGIKGLWDVKNLLLKNRSRKNFT